MSLEWTMRPPYQSKMIIFLRCKRKYLGKISLQFKKEGVDLSLLRVAYQKQTDYTVFIIVDDSSNCAL